VTERAKPPKVVDLGGLLATNVAFDLKSAEAPEERDSRLKREEAEAGHKRLMQEAEEGHKRMIALIVHIFVMAIVAIAFLVSAYLTVAGDPKTGLPDKAMGIITAIVAGGVGFITGKGSK
jgi:hypothetical protein